MSGEGGGGGEGEEESEAAATLRSAMCRIFARERDLILDVKSAFVKATTRIYKRGEERKRRKPISDDDDE